MSTVIFGCGDVGRRIAMQLINDHLSPAEIYAYVNSEKSYLLAQELGLDVTQTDLDAEVTRLQACHQSKLFYTVAPQKSGERDTRTAALLAAFKRDGICPAKVVLISTTGVYGDHAGNWVDENTATVPETGRGKRRLDAERQWLSWGGECRSDVVVLRVPAIYAHSRLPRERLLEGGPVVRAQECGFTNRIHADDLANACCVAMQRALTGEVFNVTDGTPGKISEYLQAAALCLGLPALPEISMQQAQNQLSDGMLSYLRESRKISNAKMLKQLRVKLRYPDFRQGIKV